MGNINKLIKEEKMSDAKDLIESALKLNTIELIEEAREEVMLDIGFSKIEEKEKLDVDDSEDEDGDKKKKSDDDSDDDLDDEDEE